MYKSIMALVLAVLGRAVVGSNWPQAESAIKEAVRESKIPVNVTGTRDGNEAQIHIDVGSSPSTKKAVVYLVLAHDRARSQVTRGENAGRNLSHVAVAYSIKEIGQIESQSKFDQVVSAPLARNSSAGDTRVIVFLRRANTTQIIGAAQTRL